MLGDLAALNIALITTYFLVFNETGFFRTIDFQVITLLVNLLWFAILIYSNDIYTKFEYKGFADEIKSILPHFVLYIFLFYVFSILLFRKVAFPFAIYYSCLFGLMASSRFVIRLAMSYISLNYITIGYCDMLPEIELALSEAHSGKLNNLGNFANPTSEIVEAFLKTHNVNIILYVSNSMNTYMLRRLMYYAKRNFIEFKIIPLELDCLKDGATYELHHGVFLSAKDLYASHLRNPFFKRTFDIVFSLFVIVFLLSWLLPILAFFIKIESKGKVLFFQKRIGYRGKVFRCIKFRTMSVQENGAIVEQVKRNDSRVTKVGAFLRKTNLDELTQFLNVLIGDMSVVGPRPHAVAHHTEFHNTKEDYILRHYMKPGITGWAQVNGWRGPTDTYQKISGRTDYDLWYVRNATLLLDIKIIFLTIFGAKAWKEAF